MRPLLFDDVGRAAALIVLAALAIVLTAVIVSIGVDAVWFIWTRHHVFCGLAQAPDLHCHLGAAK